MNRSDWLVHIEVANTQMERWLTGLPDDAWLDVVEGTWTVKDVIGHLAAWSDLLLDEAEALVQDGAGTVEVVDIDAWNAVQVTARREWPVEKVRATWEATVERARRVIARLSAEDLPRRCPVLWSDELVSPAELLDLWLVHVEQHRESLDAWLDGHEKKRMTST